MSLDDISLRDGDPLPRHLVHEGTSVWCLFGNRRLPGVVADVGPQPARLERGVSVAPLPDGLMRVSVRRNNVVLLLRFVDDLRYRKPE